MEGELDPLDFVLAENLHMTVEALHDQMSNREYLAWRAFLTWRQAMRAFEAKKARP